MRLAPSICAVALVAVTLAAPARADDPGSVPVALARVSGAGCPVGSFAPYWIGAPASLWVVLDAFVPEAWGGPDATGHKDCVLTVGLDAPGWQARVAAVELRGGAYLPLDASASFTFGVAALGAPGDVAHFSLASTIGEFRLQETFVDDPLAWTPCGEAPRFAVDLSGGVRTGQANEAHVGPGYDGFVIVPTFAWRRCG